MIKFLGISLVLLVALLAMSLPGNSEISELEFCEAVLAAETGAQRLAVGRHAASLAYEDFVAHRPVGWCGLENFIDQTFLAGLAIRLIEEFGLENGAEPNKKVMRLAKLRAGKTHKI
jgi:hypothetical protein